MQVELSQYKQLNEILQEEKRESQANTPKKPNISPKLLRSSSKKAKTNVFFPKSPENLKENVEKTDKIDENQEKFEENREALKKNQEVLAKNQEILAQTQELLAKNEEILKEIREKSAISHEKIEETAINHRKKSESPRKSINSPKKLLKTPSKAGSPRTKSTKTRGSLPNIENFAENSSKMQESPRNLVKFEKTFAEKACFTDLFEEFPPKPQENLDKPEKSHKEAQTELENFYIPAIKTTISLKNSEESTLLKGKFCENNEKSNKTASSFEKTEESSAIYLKKRAFPTKSPENAVNSVTFPVFVAETPKNKGYLGPLSLKTKEKTQASTILPAKSAKIAENLEKVEKSQEIFLKYQEKEAIYEENEENLAKKVFSQIEKLKNRDSEAKFKYLAKYPFKKIESYEKKAEKIAEKNEKSDEKLEDFEEKPEKLAQELIKSENSLSFEAFQRIFERLVQSHKKCGKNCKHLKRFYKILGLQTLDNQRKTLEMSKSVINKLPKI